MSKLLVYGTLRSTYGANELLGNSTLLEATASTHREYWRADAGYKSYFSDEPALYSGWQEHITGELWDVEDDAWHALDRYEGHPTFFKRETVVLDTGEEVYCYLRNPLT